MKKEFSQYIIGFSLFLILGFIFIYIPIHIYPAEDAAILFQYSENLAKTGEITYNLHGIHAEGATDFLWMLLLAFMNFLGFDTYLSSTILSMFALIGTAYILYKITKKKNIYYFYFFIVFILCLPMVPGAIQGFSPLFFGFFIALSVYYFIENNSKKLFLALLLLSLVRPDGVVFSVPLILSFLMKNKQDIRENFKLLVLYFILPGLLYFIWRWNYFGEFLPLPFYVKSTFDRYLGLFNYSSLKINYIVLRMFTPLIAFLSFIFIFNKIPKNTIALILSLVVIPTIFYSAMLLSQNVNFRFQYSIILGIILLFAFSLQYIQSKRMIFFTIGIIFYQIIVLYPTTKKAYKGLMEIPNEQITYIAQELHKITTNAKMAITEAGRLPYYSKWHAIDTWGLNTPQFSKTLIQPKDIQEYNPDLIVAHAYRGYYKFLLDSTKLYPHKKRIWNNMSENIIQGINIKDYTLLMVPFKKDGKGRYDPYLIKKGFKYHDEVKKLLLKYNAVSFNKFIQGKYSSLKEFKNDKKKILIIHSNFNVYISDKKIYYIKKHCIKKDIKSMFFLKVFPKNTNNLSINDQKNKFENNIFYFDSMGIIENNTCIASRALPLYKIEKIQTGQLYGRNAWYAEYTFNNK